VGDGCLEWNSKQWLGKIYNPSRLPVGEVVDADISWQSKY
jgi:hypothetical protein